MKRFSQSLTAVAMAGALALGGATVAQAQNGGSEPSSDSNSSETTTTSNSSESPADSGSSESPADSNSSGATTTSPAEESKTPAPLEPGDAPNPAEKQDKEGNTWYQHMQDPNLYVKDSAQVNEKITLKMRKEYNDAFPQEFDKKQLAWLALPAALIIGGIVWHLANDGKTYVKDENSKEAPSAEEKAASDKMLQENKDEVIAQGGKLAGQDAGAANTDRGMLAQTGSNTAARGLAALAVLAMVAAGAFAVRRKIFA